MLRNLHISYDLYQPGQDYGAVTDAIKSLGTWARVHQSFWYVKSRHSAAEARDIVWSEMDKNDSLYVVDATSNEAAWQNLPDDVSDLIKGVWYTKAAA